MHDRRRRRRRKVQSPLRIYVKFAMCYYNFHQESGEFSKDFSEEGHKISTAAARSFVSFALFSLMRLLSHLLFSREPSDCTWSNRIFRVFFMLTTEEKFSVYSCEIFQVPGHFESLPLFFSLRKGKSQFSVKIPNPPWCCSVEIRHNGGKGKPEQLLCGEVESWIDKCWTFHIYIHPFSYKQQRTRYMWVFAKNLHSLFLLHWCRPRRIWRVGKNVERCFDWWNEGDSKDYLRRSWVVSLRDHLFHFHSSHPHTQRAQD